MGDLTSRDRKGAVSQFDMSSPSVTDPNKKKLEELARLGWYHSMELPDGRVIPGFQSLDVLRNRIAQFPVPADLRGKRALDIGAWDGWFTFELERRGARVMAVDSTAFERFRVARDLLGSQAEYRIDDVCRLSPAKIGYFDIVMFLGVLYHLKHPMLALEKVCELSTDMVCIESFVSGDGSDLAAKPRSGTSHPSTARPTWTSTAGLESSTPVCFLIH